MRNMGTASQARFLGEETLKTSTLGAPRQNRHSFPRKAGISSGSRSLHFSARRKNRMDSPLREDDELKGTNITLASPVPCAHQILTSSPPTPVIPAKAGIQAARGSLQPVQPEEKNEGPRCSALLSRNKFLGLNWNGCSR